MKDSVLIDVRSPSEYAAGHLPGSMNIPLEHVESRMADIPVNGRAVVLVCQSGKRAGMCAEVLRRRGFANVEVLAGGLARSGRPLVRTMRSRWSLERQVRLGAGVMILLSLTLAAVASPLWLGLTAFAGLGLTFAGLTDICMMGSILARMPWNGPAPVSETLE